MKKILFLENDFDFGGREKVSLDLINGLVKDGQFEVDLFLLHEGGIWDKNVSEKVNRVNIFDIPIENVRALVEQCDEKYSLARNIRKRKYFSAIKLLFQRKYRKNRSLRYGDLCSHIKQDRYDFVVCPSLTISAFLIAVAAKTNAERKLVWIHRAFCKFRDRKKFNIKSVATINSVIHDVDLIEQFDKIVCVSDKIKNTFDYYFTNLSDKSVVAYNAMDIDSILMMSREHVHDIPKRENTICTVGRIEKEKGIMLAIDAALLMRNNGIDFVWYFVGTGSLSDKALIKVKKYGLSQNIYFLGGKLNPYPYIAQCDIYCQPSLTEAYCTTVNEARILRKPVVATDFTGIREQIDNNIDGLICPIDKVALANALTQIIKDKLYFTLAEKARYPKDNERDKIFSVKNVFDAR